MRFSTILSIVLKNFEAWFFRLIGRSDKIIPYKILLQTTNDCNSKCDTCHIWKINKENPELRNQEVNLEQTEEVFKNLNKSLLWLSFSGGEVTMHDETNEMVKLAKKHCPNLKFVTFTTNGLLPERAVKLAQSIKDLGLDSFVTISLDGNEDIHDKVRGIPGNYKKALKTLEAIKEIGVKAHFGITLSEDNHDFVMEEFQDYSSTMRAVTFVHNEGIYNKKAKLDDQKIIKSLKKIYSLYDLQSLSDIVEKLHIRLAIRFLEKQRKVNLVPCDAGYSSLHVFPRGEVSPCMFLEPAGNLNSSSLSEIINSKKYEDLRLDAREGRCAKCWMNCYSPHSIMQSPFRTLWEAGKTKVGL